jgi:hypothetical protein
MRLQTPTARKASGTSQFTRTEFAGAIFLGWRDNRRAKWSRVDDAEFILSSILTQNTIEEPMDADLDALSREQLIMEIKRLRGAIREHRDSTGHDLCWHQPALWSLLPEKVTPAVAVPAWPQFMRGCIRYRQSLDEQAPSAPRISAEFGHEGDAQARST